MKLKIYKSIENVGDYDVVDKNCYFIKNNHIFQDPDRKIVTISNYWGINFELELIHVFTNRSQNSFYDYDGNLILRKDNANIYHIINKSEFIWYDRVLKSTLFNNHNLIAGKLKKYFVDGKLIYYFNNNLVKALSFTEPNKNQLWQYDLLSLGTFNQSNKEVNQYEVKHFIGIYKNQLITQLSNATFLF